MRTRCHVFPEVVVTVTANGILPPQPGSLTLPYNVWVCGCVKDISSGPRGSVRPPGIYFRESAWNPAAEAGVFLGMGWGLLFLEKQPLFREIASWTS